MSHLFGVGLNIESNRINTQIKMHLQKRGGIGLRALTILLHRADLAGQGCLSVQEFERTLGSFNIFPTKVELQTLVKAFGNGSDAVEYERFLGGLRGTLNDRRMNIVRLAFENVDVNRNGKLSMEEISNKYDVTFNQDFQEGRMQKQEILNTFLDGFVLGDKKPHCISWQMWLDYYSDLSLSIADDTYFVRMLEAIWQVNEDGTVTVAKQELERLTRTIRLKLLALSNQNSDEYVLRNVFRHFDTDGNGVLSSDEFSAMLSKLQLSCSKRYLDALLRKFDRNGSGVVEFEELLSFLTGSPYK